MNYKDFIEQPSSEKIILAIAEANTEFKNWIFAGMPYTFYKDVAHFVSAVKVDGVNLIKRDSNVLDGPTTSGQFYFDIKNKRLYIRMPSDISPPRLKQVIVTYKFFFSNASIILPWDLKNGEDVYFEGRISALGSLGQQLDDENTGVVLESSSQLSLHNNDGFFDDIFETIIWENQKVEYYSWGPKIPLSEARRIFVGVIESKSFSRETISFKVKDYVYKLKNNLSIGTFSEADGVIADSLLGKSKRRIYGRVKQVKCAGIDNILDGYSLTGSIALTIDSDQVHGTGTNFFKELSEGDEIAFDFNKEEIKITVQSIQSNTLFTASRESEFNAPMITSAIVKPDNGYRFKNRKWHLAGHRLSELTYKITGVRNSRAYVLESVKDLYEGDIVEINGVTTGIQRISGKSVFLEQSIFPIAHINDEITRKPVTALYWGSQRLELNRDYTLSNNDEAIVELNDLAEFNVRKIKRSSISFAFTNGSNSVTTSQDVDLRTILSPRDWIRKQSQSLDKWYEILSVDTKSFTLRGVYDQAGGTEVMLYKNMEFIDDDSLITCDCYGIEVNGKWIKTPSDTVRHLVLNDSMFDEVNEESFSIAREECDYIMSMALPESLGNDSPQVKEVITKVNDSVFGSLYGDSNSKISYSILNSEKPEDMLVVRDDDILSFTVSSTQKIVNEVTVLYRPFVDFFNDQDAFESINYISEFVNNFTGIANKHERKLYLYESDKAETIAQRIAFFNSLSNNTVKIKAKLKFALTAVNDKIKLSLMRLYSRYAGGNRSKIGIVTGTVKDGLNTEISITDMGNIFNRVPAIAPNNTNDIEEATEDEITRYGFIVDNEYLTPQFSKEELLGSNLIG